MKTKLSLILIYTVFLSACTQDPSQTDYYDPSTNRTEENIQEDEMLQDRNNSAKPSYDEQPDMVIDETKQYHAILRTNKGDIKLKLFADKAPVTVNNFVFLAQENFYDGVIFHRVIPEFMIQGGDPTGTGMGGPGYEFDDEIHEENNNNKGTIAMANAGPGTNGSQFFINVVDNNYLDTKHTVFGEIVEGLNIAEEISKVPTGAANKPIDDIVIEDVVIEEA